MFLMKLNSLRYTRSFDFEKDLAIEMLNGFWKRSKIPTLLVLDNLDQLVKYFLKLTFNFLYFFDKFLIYYTKTSFSLWSRLFFCVNYLFKDYRLYFKYQNLYRCYSRKYDTYALNMQKCENLLLTVNREALYFNNLKLNMNWFVYFCNFKPYLYNFTLTDFLSNYVDKGIFSNFYCRWVYNNEDLISNNWIYINCFWHGQYLAEDADKAVNFEWLV